MADYSSKFSMGQKVWVVSSSEHYRIVRCELCNSTGSYKINDEEFICPKCEGRASKRVYAGRKHYLWECGHIGKISIEHQVGGYLRDDEPSLKVSYMIDSTGIGSGSVHGENNLYPSMEEAQAFVDRMNSSLLPDEAVGTTHSMASAPVRF